MKTAVLVDGGFYRKLAKHLYGKKSPDQRADELHKYCLGHVNEDREHEEAKSLYRIFYYDCPPIEKSVWHPYLKQNVNFGKLDTYQWMMDFHNALRNKRKVALRLGVLSDERAAFVLSQNKLKDLLFGKISLDDLSENDFHINFEQKGVDMRIGLDIASMAYKKQVDQIVLISGDSDFVPAAKLARREGIDFILDPMGTTVKADLYEHIDGLRSSSWKPSKKGSKQNRKSQEGE